MFSHFLVRALSCGYQSAPFAPREVSYDPESGVHTPYSSLVQPTFVLGVCCSRHVCAVASSSACLCLCLTNPRSCMYTHACTYIPPPAPRMRKLHPSPPRLPFRESVCSLG